MPSSGLFQGVQYSFLRNTWGVAGALMDRPGRVFEVRFVVYTAATAVAYLFDHSRYPQNPIGTLNAGGGLPDTYPRQPIALPMRRGVYVSFSMGSGCTDVGIAFGR